MDDRDLPTFRRLRPLIFVMAGVLVLFYVVQRVQSNESVRHDPPAACQLVGGTWNWWDGWRC